MADVEVRFDMTGMRQAIRRYETKTQNIPMDLMGQLMVSEADNMFETEGAAGSEGAWAPLMPSTIARSPRRAGGKILQDTGATANIQVGEISGFSVTVLSPTGYSGFLAGGTENMVRRDFFAFTFSNVLDAMGDLVLQEFQR